MLFEKSTNVNINIEQVDQSPNPKENQREHNNSTSSSINYYSAFNDQEISNSLKERLIASNNNLAKNNLTKNIPSQPFVGSGYFGLGIPKSPSFHSGLDLLADDQDNEKISLKEQTKATKFENINAGSGIGSKFKFTNIEEIKAKLSNSSFSTISTVKKEYINQMPAFQPQEVNQLTDQSISSNSSAISVTSSSPLPQQQLPSSYVINTSGAAFNTTTSKDMSVTTSTSREIGTPSTVKPISATTSSIVSTLAQHFNAATSATQLLTTASSTLGSNNKSPVSAATAIKNILNATKSVGGSAFNNTSTINYNTNSIYNTAESTTTTTVASLSTSNSSTTQHVTTSNINSSSVTQSIVSGISISLGLGNTSNNVNKSARNTNNCSNVASIKLQINANGCGGTLTVPYQNGSENSNDNRDENSAGINMSEEGGSNCSGELMSQTLQQITGSPGRARDRNVFHTPTAAVQLPLLRGF